MKKVMMLAAVAAVLVSCQSKENANKDNMEVTNEEAITATEKTVSATGSTYKGTLPAADGPGIEYVLSIEDEEADGESNYTLITTYLEADGPGKDRSFTSKGKKSIVRKEEKNGKRKAIKLTPDNGDASLYFIVVNDSTLRLVNENLEEAINGLNYDIIRMQ